ncbi:glycosyltransferase family 25 protein [Mycolicibacterium vanbaalenii]|nr:glycosyltransferase family 25 protein [Mycolicibacterium vanbaalenii]
MPAYVIGIPSAYRGEKLERQLTEQGISWNRVEGVLFDRAGSDHNLVDDRAAKLLLRREILPGEVGCALAHRRVYQLMVRQRVSMALVFEDDARLSTNLNSQHLHELLNTRIPRVLMLSFDRSTVVPRDLRVRRDPEIHRALVPPTTTTAYALNMAAASLLMDNGRPIAHVADWPVRPSADVEFFFPSSPVAHPDADTASTIGSRNLLSVRSQSALSTTIPSVMSRSMRRICAIMHITWLRHRRIYGTYRAYVVHEFVRMPAFKIAKCRRG